MDWHLTFRRLFEAVFLKFMSAFCVIIIVMIKITLCISELHNCLNAKFVF